MPPREEPQPLLPQFSIRWLLGLTTVCAFFFTFLGIAARGRAWAISVSVGMGTLVLMVLIYALLFGLTWIIAAVVFRRRGDRGESRLRSTAPDDRPAASEGAADQDAHVETEIVP